MTSSECNIVPVLTTENIVNNPLLSYGLIETAQQTHPTPSGIQMCCAKVWSDVVKYFEALCFQTR